MELKEHLKIYKNYKWFILVFAVAVAVAAFVFVMRKPDTYTIAESFQVQLTNRPATSDYQYGAYYDLKGAEMFTQHAMSWLMTPAFIQEVYAEAGLGTDVEELSSYTSRFKAKQYSSQNFYVSFTDYSAEQGRKIGEALGRVMEKESLTVDTNLAGASYFEIQASDPVVVKNVINPWLIGLVGMLAGLVLSITLVYLREYFRS